MCSLIFNLFIFHFYFNILVIIIYSFDQILILVENEKNAEIMISTLRGCAEINKIVFHSGFYSNNSTKFSSLELPPRTKYLLNYGYLLLPNNMNPSMR